MRFLPPAAFPGSMAEPPGKSNLERERPTETELEGNMVRIWGTFEEDKARKEKYKKYQPWPEETWRAATVAARAGVVELERRFSVIITSPTGPFTTPQELQEIADLPSLPEVKMTTLKSVLREKEQVKELEEVRYCDVN